ncbi:hypothetical protein KFL_004340140 [Klebsormidium nitens]|uniref:Protein SirB1 N-terminal domain-containing protein n=1 Tax=Klebsormidium nitens TaxID=105231 RepID=A0A1Y1IIL9_KLENI|nr:hypothetical protein KFL_004340140 [Klebsormidium nitens]|eukprot:GAQ88507.1 hypothetical protein KFL_004340140 [Klebsormidium nitens]
MKYSSCLKTSKDPCRTLLRLQRVETFSLNTNFSDSRGGRKFCSTRLHALEDEDRDNSEQEKREDRSGPLGETRSVSTGESLAEEDLGEVSERWDGNESEAGGSTSSSGVNAKAQGISLERPEETVGPSDSSTSGAEANAEGTSGEEAQTQRVLDILHRRKEQPARDQGPSLRERFGGFRVSGPQVPLTLQPLKLKKGDEGPAEASKESTKIPESNIELKESAQNAEGNEEPEVVKLDVSQESVSSLEDSQSAAEDLEDARLSTSGENAAPESTAELSPDVPEVSDSKAPNEEDSNEKGEKKKKPVVIPPGPSVAEIPIPPRTDEDERLIAVFEKKLNADWKVDGVESELGLYIAKVKALESFQSELARPDDDIDLVRAAALIAQHAYPEASPEACDAELRLMAEDLTHELPPPAERYPLRMIAAINKFLYEQRDFKKNSGQNADEMLSLNNVLKCKTGDRILLSLIYLELARRVGFPMQTYTLAGVYFVVRPLAADSTFYVDASDKGKLMFLADVQAKLRKIFFASITVYPDYFERKEPISKREFLVHILTTLKHDYLEKRNFVRCLAVIEYLKVARKGPEGASELRDAGVCLFSLRRIPEATSSLEQYLAIVPNAPDATYVREWLRKIREGRMGGSE